MEQVKDKEGVWKCANSGNKYEIEEGFGVMEQIQGQAGAGLSDEMMAEIKNDMIASGGDSIDLEEKTVMAYMGADDMRKFLTGGSKDRSQILATVIVSCNGKSIGKNEDERMKWVRKMNWKDALEIVSHMKDVIKEFAKVSKEIQGNSQPSSSAGTKEAESIPSLRS